jgi:hypothetical protein
VTTPKHPLDSLFTPPVLRQVARRAFKDRNARGAPSAGALAKLQQSDIRQHCRNAIRSARKARDAYVGGDQQAYLVAAADAVRCVDAARAEYFRVLALFYRKGRSNTGSGRPKGSKKPDDQVGDRTLRRRKERPKT